MIKLPLKDKIFWKNFIQGLLLFALFVFLFGIRFDSDSDKIYFQFLESYILFSSISVIYLCIKIALSFVKNEEIEDFRKKKSMSQEEFRNKYGEIMDIYK